MISIDEFGRGRGFLRTHALDLFHCKAIRLEIGQAPISIAETGSGDRSRTIGLDGVPLLADGLEGVAEQKLQMRPARRRRNQLTVQGYCALVLPETGTHGRMERKVVPVVGLELQEARGLLARLQSFPLIDQHPGIVGSRSLVSWCESQRFLQQPLRIIERLALMHDPPEQAQRFDVSARRAQVCPNYLLCRCRLAVTEQTARVHDLGRQSPEHCELPGRQRGFLHIACDAIQALEHAPAGGQRRIDVDTALEGIDCARHIVYGRETVTALLMQAAEARMLLLEALQRCQRCSTLVEATLVHGSEIKSVAAPG